jgi:hypothetical protein
LNEIKMDVIENVIKSHCLHFYKFQRNRQINLLIQKLQIYLKTKPKTRKPLNIDARIIQNYCNELVHQNIPIHSIREIVIECNAKKKVRYSTYLKEKNRIREHFEIFISNASLKLFEFKKEIQLFIFTFWTQKTEQISPFLKWFLRKNKQNPSYYIIFKKWQNSSTFKESLYFLKMIKQKVEEQVQTNHDSETLHPNDSIDENAHNEKCKRSIELFNENIIENNLFLDELKQMDVKIIKKYKFLKQNIQNFETEKEKVNKIHLESFKNLEEKECTKIIQTFQIMIQFEKEKSLLILEQMRTMNQSLFNEYEFFIVHLTKRKTFKLIKKIIFDYSKIKF